MTAAPRALVFAVVPALGWKVARALGRDGSRPIITGPASLKRWGRLGFCERYVALESLRPAGPDDIDPVVFDELEAVCRRNAIDVVVPADLPTALLLAHEQHRLRCAQTFPLSPAKLLRRLHDKWWFSELLSTLDLPQPKTRLLGHIGDADELRFPILTKVRDRSNGEGIVHHASRAALRGWLSGPMAPPSGRCLAQEVMAGEDVGVTLLAEHGRLVAYAAFRHHRRWSRTFFRDVALEADVRTLVRHVGYHGVGHLDARRDAHGRCAFLELNPRFAGSLLYCARAEVNVAQLGLQLAAGRAPTHLVAPRPRRFALPLADRALGAVVTAHGRYLAAAMRRARARQGIVEPVAPALRPFPPAPDNPKQHRAA